MKYLMLDKRNIDSYWGVDLTMNTPYQDHKPVIIPENPWEDNVKAYGTVMRDKDYNDSFRMWYVAGKNNMPEHVKLVNKYEEDKATLAKYQTEERICFACSSDGIKWWKPNLLSYNGQAANIIMGDERTRYQSMSVVKRDTGAYRMWTSMQTRDDRTNGIRRWHSTNGLDWKQYLPDEPNPPGNQDSLNTVLWNGEKYVGFQRKWHTYNKGTAEQYAQRTFWRVISYDFEKWELTHEIRLNDAYDDMVIVNRKRGAPVLDFYTQPVMLYEGLYLMFPQAYWHWGDSIYVNETTERLHHKGGFPDRCDTQMAVSYDGIEWYRDFRQPFLRCGTEDQPDSGQVGALIGLIPTGDEMWLYYGGKAGGHGNSKWGPTGSGIFRAVMRRDGIVSADASYIGGELVTKPFKPEGKTLYLNIDTSAGGCLRVEAWDKWQHAIRDFELENSPEINGNKIKVGAPIDFGRLIDEKIQLRFVMRDCKLYSWEL